MVDIEKTIQEKDQNLIDSLNFREPKKVPVGIEVISWPFGYAGVTYKEVMGDPKLAADSYLKFLDDIEIDYTWGYAGVTKPLTAYQTLGSDNYYLGSDDTTIAHAQVNENSLRDDEYDELIKDPYYYADEILLKRKVPAFNQPKEKAYEKLLEALKEFRLTQEMNDLIGAGFYNKGVTNLSKDGPKYSVPLDFLFDRVRGMKDTLIDLRRRPDKVKAVCDKVFEIDMANMREKPSDYEGKDGLFCGLTVYHSASFLNDKQYKEMFLSYLIKGFKAFFDVGVHMFLKGEGKFIQKLHGFRELPKGSMVIMLEEDDPFECYKEIGDWATLATGITGDLLKYGTKQQCIDYVKKCYDTFAPGGGFIFMQDRPLLGVNDAKIENVIATYGFANEYGKKR